MENPDDESSTGGSSSSGDTPTGPVLTGIMTTDNPTGTTADTSTGAPSTTTTTGPDPTTGETDTSTGDAPLAVVEGLSHPESILHDKADDVYLISNINGAPDVEDDNGFISRVMPDGTVEALTWIDGASGDIVLSAPKGMGIHEDHLYVADLTQVHKFDRVSGAQLASIPVPGASFLNDIAVNPFGRVFVSDTTTSKIHVIETDDTVTDFVTSQEIPGTNGLAFGTDVLFAVGYNGADLFQIPIEGPIPAVVFTVPAGQLDGIARIPGSDDLLVSSWESQTVYRVAADFTDATPVVAGVEAPADIEVDQDRMVLLIPQLLLDKAVFYPL
jgi:hypothetical protein